MVEETLKKIETIEERARKIIEEAEKSKIISVNRARKRTEELLLEIKKSAQLEALAIIEQARKEAEKEKQEIERKNQIEIEELRKRTEPKMKEVRARCR